MHVANKGELLPGQEQEHIAGPGRPSDPGTFGTHDSPHGRAPLAIKQLGKSLGTDKSPLQHKYRGGSPLSTESTEAAAIIQQLEKIKKTPKIIQESLSEKKEDPDKGTLLDEKNLIGNEKP